jgi:hypothetical protein
MPEPASESKVIITASPREHPAVRKLARAVIALVHQAQGEAAAPVQPPRPDTRENADREGSERANG